MILLPEPRVNQKIVISNDQFKLGTDLACNYVN